MVQLGRRRSPGLHSRETGADRRALLLYTTLVLVPALVLVGLLFTQLRGDHARQLAQLPRDVRDSAGRLRSGIENRLRNLVAREDTRSFYHFNQDYWEEGTVLSADGQQTLAPITSPLAHQARPAGVRGWFSWHIGPAVARAPLFLRGQPHVPGGLSQTEEVEFWSNEAQRGMDQEQFVHDVLMWHESQQVDPSFDGALQPEEFEHSESVPIELLALNLASHRDPACLNADIAALRSAIGDLQTLPVQTLPFELQGRRDRHHNLRVVALREVLIESLPGFIEVPRCFEVLEQDTRMVQGFELDLDWLLDTMPHAEAKRILSPGMRFGGPGLEHTLEDRGLITASFNLFDELDIQLEDESDLPRATMTLGFPSNELRSRLATQLAFVVSVGIAMVISLGIGVQLLRRSVRKSQEHARQTENFLAAVTHELRTPLSAVKLYGEMLQAGWVKDEQQRSTYLNHILQGANRLDGLVDGLLESRRLATTTAEPELRSLNSAIEACADDLKPPPGAASSDLVFELGENLPEVQITASTVRGILVNLVENARKYAPLAPNGEPYLIRTSLDARGRVCLEVGDRGPGIPRSERSRVFGAFYRIGDEGTRPAQGTGLGLHLVQMHVDALGGRIKVHERPGGGALFKVTFVS